MSDERKDDQPDSRPAKAEGGAALSGGAKHLFGHKSGASPWEAPVGGVQSDEDAVSRPAPSAPETSSAPYPRDARYTPRPEAEGDARHAPIFGEVDDDGELTKLHPNYKLMMRVGAIFFALVIAVGGLVAEGFASSELGLPFGLVLGPAVIVALIIAIRVPAARYNARGYQISRDRLRVVRGVLFRADTIVPFGRVQHIDVDQGPIERALGIATMTLHTAGSHNASVRLPGLGHELAIRMREEIRAHIKRESM